MLCRGLNKLEGLLREGFVVPPGASVRPSPSVLAGCSFTLLQEGSDSSITYTCSHKGTAFSASSTSSLDMR